MVDGVLKGEYVSYADDFDPVSRLSGFTRFDGVSRSSLSSTNFRFLLNCVDGVLNGV